MNKITVIGGTGAGSIARDNLLNSSGNVVVSVNKDKHCSSEMIKLRSGLIFGANEAPKILPAPYVRCHEMVKWL
ncbi:MAG: hypothetical protein ACTH7L_14180 [Psychrobacter alimentarius]